MMLESCCPSSPRFHRCVAGVASTSIIRSFSSKSCVLERSGAVPGACWDATPVLAATAAACLLSARHALSKKLAFEVLKQLFASAQGSSCSGPKDDAAAIADKNRSKQLEKGARSLLIPNSLLHSLSLSVSARAAKERGGRGLQAALARRRRVWQIHSVQADDSGQCCLFGSRLSS
jgi:hypothetical protein